jgi:hypothetical protein
MSKQKSIKSSDMSKIKRDLINVPCVNMMEKSGSRQRPERVNWHMHAKKAPSNHVIIGNDIETGRYSDRMKKQEAVLNNMKEFIGSRKTFTTSDLETVFSMTEKSAGVPIMEKDAKKAVLNAVSDMQQNSVVNGIGEFYARQLAQFYPVLIFKRYPEFQYEAYTSIYNGAPYATQMVTELFDYTGLGDMQFDQGTRGRESNDIIVVGANVDERVDPVFVSHLAIDFEITEQFAIQQADRYGIGEGQTSPIVTAKFLALARAQEQILNERCLGVVGNSVYNYQGIFDAASGVPRETIGVGIPGTDAGSWTTKTQAQILNDIVRSVNYLNTKSKGVFRANTLVMSNEAYNIFTNIPRSEFSDMSVEEWVLRNLRGIERIVPDPYIDGIGAGGTNVMYISENAPENHYFSVNAKSYGMRPDYYQGSQLRLPFLMASSGFILIQQNSCLIVEGL